jgi:cob(I)alamin adenosyltransferase
MKGYVQVYTGNGKGKTTAALGLILRAAGAGLGVFLCQFMKKRPSAEIGILRARFSGVTVRRFGRRSFVRGRPSPEDIRAAKRGLAELRAAMRSGRYRVIVADEANVAVSIGLFPVDELLRLVDEKPEDVELVFTGRGADRRLIRRADLVTEMKAVKHYFDAGVAARHGIEF